MSVLKELVTVAAKTAVGGALKGKSLLKDALSSAAGLAAGGVAEEAAKKAGLMRTNMNGDLVLKVPLFKTTEVKMAEAIAEHPERDKVCFHLPDTVMNGAVFYDPDGEKVYEIRGDKKNLKHLELYERDKYVGRIDKHVTWNFNPLKDIQRYDAVK